MGNTDGTTLEVTIYPGLAPEDIDEPTIFEGIDYVSLVSDETYGPPAVIAPAKGQDRALAQPDDRVLYINTHFVPMWEITRKRG